MEGGEGNDHYFVRDAGDVVVEFDDHPESNTDTVHVFGLEIEAYTLGENFEHLDLSQGDLVGPPVEEFNHVISATGNGLNNTIIGNDADNILDGAGGDDRIFGGRGDDTYHVDTSFDTIIEFDGPEGSDLVVSSVRFTLSANLEDLILQAGAGGIDGTGNSLDNTIVGNESDNTIRGEDGEDLLKGGGGADVLRGGNRDDQLYGNSGDDDLGGGGGDDEMYGGANNDTYSVASIGDFVFELSDEGVDTVNVSNIADYVLPENFENLNLLSGAVNAIGNVLANTIVGNRSDNTIDGGFGNDALDGDDGIDTASFVSWDPTGAYNPASETIRIVLGADGSATRTSNLLRVTLETDTLIGFENVRGSNRSETIVGDDGDNLLEGRGGSDVLQGNGGSDELDGGAGTDTASYKSSLAFVTAVLPQNGIPGAGYEFSTGPNQEVISEDTLVSIENLRGSSFGDTLIGDEAVNELRGNDGNDILNGGANRDRLIGGFGHDTYIVDNIDDTITEFGGQGIDQVHTSVSYTLTAGADIEVFRTTNSNATVAIDLTGNASGNEITGNNGANMIDGGGGNDQLIGRGGDDTYIVDSASDTITENGGQGIDTVQASVTFTLTAGADVENLRTTNDAGTAAINLSGNANGNNVIGNNGNNTLNGGDGRDELTGLGGTDLFLFNTALDPAFNVDEITDFSVADDTIVLENAVFTALPVAGNLARNLTAAEFVVSTAAQDASDRIIYNSSTGALFYDADGVGGVAAIQFATVGPGLPLTPADFLVV